MSISKPTINVFSRKSIVPVRIVDISIKVRKFTEIVRNFNIGTTNIIEVESKRNVKRVYRKDVGNTIPEKSDMVKKKIKIYRNRFFIYSFIFEAVNIIFVYLNIYIVCCKMILHKLYCRYMTAQDIVTKTKILATIGPASWDEDVLRDMISNGMDIARINASFADFDELERVSRLIRSISPRISIMLDTKGHKIRVTGFEQPIELKEDDMVVLIPDLEGEFPSNYIKITYDRLHLDLNRGARVAFDDGNIQAIVEDIKDKEVFCKIQNNGVLKSGKTVNAPGSKLSFTGLTDKDKGDIEYAVKNKFDFISASFIKSPDDVNCVRELVGDSDIQIIAKIEDQSGVDNFDEILKVADGIMIARGDLGIEIPLEQVPILQKQFVYKCRSVGKPVVVATQMLESMRDNPRPTRAEVSDVANAVMDGCDCVMLSAETSTGEFPVDTVKQMNDIALNTESFLIPQEVYGRTDATDDTDELCNTVFRLTKSLDIKCVLAISQSGKTVRSLSRHRLSILIYEVSDNVGRIRKDNILRGVKGYYIKNLPEDRDDVIERAAEVVFSYGVLDFNDKIVIISGSSIKNKDTNTILEISTVKDILGR